MILEPGVMPIKAVLNDNLVPCITVRCHHFWQFLTKSDCSYKVIKCFYANFMNLYCYVRQNLTLLLISLFYKIQYWLNTIYGKISTTMLFSKVKKKFGAPIPNFGTFQIPLWYSFVDITLNPFLQNKDNVIWKILAQQPSNSF